MVERQLPKLHTRVRFPSPAPSYPVGIINLKPSWHQVRKHLMFFVNKFQLLLADSINKTMVAPETSLPSLAQIYLHQLATARRMSPLTLKNYRDDLQLFFRAHPDISPTLITEMQVRRLVMAERERGCVASTLARRLSAWRSFYRWLIGEGQATMNPVANVHAPKAARHLPDTLTPDQLSGLLDSIRHAAQQSPASLHSAHSPSESPAPTASSQSKASITAKNAPIIALRDWAVAELFYSSGLRLNELLAINLSQASIIMSGELRVIGKGDKERIVPVGSFAQQAISAWLARRGEWVNTADEPALFVTPRGKRLSPRTAQNQLAKWAKKAGLPGAVHPHMLRHSFASHLLQSSGDLRSVQEMLGHSSLRATQIYTHLDFNALAKVYDRAHPRAHASVSDSASTLNKKDEER
jgi:integrase/recombinase XerC